MIFSTIKITFLVFAAFAVGTQAQKGKNKCGSCVKKCVKADETVTDKQEEFTFTCNANPLCVIECDSVEGCADECGEDVKCLRKCKRSVKKCNKTKSRKENRCRKQCKKKLMKTDTVYKNILATAKVACEAGQCKIEPECDVSECNCDCDGDGDEDEMACKKECKKCKGALMKVCHSTCVNNSENEGGRCDCGCASCDTTCACDKNDEQCKEVCKTCKNTLKTCTKTCTEKTPTAKECVTECGCDYPFKKRKPKRKGSGKFL